MLILIWPFRIPILSLQVQGLRELQLSTGFYNIQPEKESGDPPAAMTSCSPASDKTSQVSRAEEPYGETYAELNTRALSEGPSSQMEQPLETCVYSTLKA